MQEWDGPAFSRNSGQSASVYPAGTSLSTGDAPGLADVSDII
ncbi:MAG: hypothetical protein ABI876_18525 [Bacteroidota bacterium]